MNKYTPPDGINKKDQMSEVIKYDMKSFLQKFYSQNDLSLQQFKIMWKLEDMGHFHHCIPDHNAFNRKVLTTC